MTKNFKTRNRERECVSKRERERDSFKLFDA